MIFDTYRKERREGCWSADRNISVKLLSHVQLFATPWTATHQAPLSMRFSRQGYWSGLPFPSPGYLHFTKVDMSMTVLDFLNK